MPEIPLEVEAQLAAMSEGEWAALSAKVRAPDTAEAFRTAAAQHVPADRLDSITRIVDPSKFVGADGSIDADRVGQQLGRLFGSSQAPQQWGQTSAPAPPAGRAGDAGRAALRRRHGVGAEETNQPAPDTQITRGAGAKAELARRYGKGNR